MTPQLIDIQTKDQFFPLVVIFMLLCCYQVVLSECLHCKHYVFCGCVHVVMSPCLRECTNNIYDKSQTEKVATVFFCFPLILPFAILVIQNLSSGKMLIQFKAALTENEKIRLLFSTNPLRDLYLILQFIVPGVLGKAGQTTRIFPPLTMFCETVLGVLATCLSN